MKYLVVGLGNIGADYRNTRHNIGFEICDWVREKYEGATFEIDKLALKTEVKIKGKRVILLKPTTYMNLSGKAIKYWMDKEKIPLSQVFVLLDDLALPLAKIRVKGRGSDGGHNGLKSIQTELGADNYARLRFGIGNDFQKGKQVDFVLGHWTEKENALIAEKKNTCIEVVESFVFRGLTQTMNIYNQ